MPEHRRHIRPATRLDLPWLAPGEAIPDVDVWTDDYGTDVLVHPASACADETACAVHNPSDHSMAEFKQLWRVDRGIIERICPHGVGHPDPDMLAYTARTQGRGAARAESIHGCDGCCS